VTNDVPAPKVAVALMPARVEPVFFNGKTYKMAMTPVGQGSYVIAISGMGSNQTKDANELTKTAFHHFTCKDSQVVRLSAAPNFDGSKWNAQGRCA
jgi:hypothetical protein